MDAGPEREHGDPPSTGKKRGVLGTFLLLVLFLSAASWIARNLLIGSVSGPEKQREYFGDRALPFALELEQAERLPTGDTLVRFERPAGGGSGPGQVFFIEYESRAAVEPLFRGAADEGPGGEKGAGSRLAEWERDKAFAWHMTKKRDEIAWGEWRSKLLIERAFEKGGGWSEQARVDLSSERRALVLFAHWPAETPVNEQELRELLAAIELKR